MMKSSYLTYFDYRQQQLLYNLKAFPRLWRLFPPFIPHKIHRKWRSTRSRLLRNRYPPSSIASLKTSFSPTDTLRSMRTHQWSYYDGQYLLLAVVGIFSLCVIESPGPLLKTFIATLLMVSLVLPITRQFFLPLLPVAGWLVFFYASQFISGEYRPPIWVRILPTLENILYGANLSNILSAHKHIILDILAWITYGITHFGGPFVCSAVIFIWGPPGTLPVFVRGFGYMNLTGVAIQLIFPCSPPWYENKYGLAPANYSMPGSPAGLAAIDELFGIDLYTSGFTASPLVFGAFPSLHSGWATLEALFLSHVFPRLSPVFILYTLWLWWSTMYLSHHYAVDLVGGSLISGLVYFVARAQWLPRLQHDKDIRWDYDYVEIGETNDDSGYNVTAFYEEFHPASDDDWTVESSSMYYSETRSPSTAPRSPFDDAPSLWEGDTWASTSDTVV